MIGQCLLNKNESATVAENWIFCKLNKAFGSSGTKHAKFCTSTVITKICLRTRHANLEGLLPWRFSALGCFFLWRNNELLYEKSVQFLWHNFFSVELCEGIAYACCGQNVSILHFYGYYMGQYYPCSEYHELVYGGKMNRWSLMYLYLALIHFQLVKKRASIPINKIQNIMDLNLFF